VDADRGRADATTRSSRSAGPSRESAHPLAETRYAIGAQNRKRGAALEAVSDFVEAVRFDPDHAKAWFSLAGLYETLGRPEDALCALRRWFG
jgi:Tfp pilus assembly protein PilF